MLASMVVILLGAAGVAGLDTEALPCPNAVSAWTGSTGPYMNTLDLTVDADGNVILCGYFSTGSDLDPTDGVDERIANGHHPDIYVTKVNADGSYAWSYTVGALDVTDSAGGVALDPNGEIVAVGSFHGTVDFDPGPEVDEFTPPGEYAAFVTRLAPDGTYLSTFTFGGPGRVGVSGIEFDQNGDILLVGSFGGTVDFDPGPGEVRRSGISDIFVSKLAPDGSHLWTHATGSTAYDSGRDIAVDSDGNVYASGTFRGSVDFDPGPGVDEHTVVGWVENLFVTKYYADGSYAWTRTYDVVGREIALTAAGGVVLTGLFYDTVDFDPGEGIDRRTSRDDPDASTRGDIFVTKLNPNGSYGWTYTVGGPRGDAGAGVDTDDEGNLFVTGYFSESVDFDPGVGVDLHESIGQEDVFVTKLSPDGTFRRTRTFGGQDIDEASYLALDGKGDAFVVGHYWESFPYPDYDPGCEVAVMRSHEPGGADIFIMKLVCPELSADFDGNGVVDLRDAAQFQLCFTDEGPTTCGDGCSRLDLHPDDDIDLDDFYDFQSALTGP